MYPVITANYIHVLMFSESGEHFEIKVNLLYAVPVGLFNISIAHMFIDNLGEHYMLTNAKC